ncbi:MAG TPA: DNA primase, partial [Candidatus Kapabacteria bacterium]|nr:DNA primase [Candidatus Kapabacteria bacterium]
VDLVAEHVRLKKRGRNFVGLCPFHNEKTPSFNVQEDKGIFKCFGCGKGGDAFSFVMQMEALTFPEALRKLAKRANIEIEGEQSELEDAARSERESLQNVLREAAAYYYRRLRAPEGSAALAYLRARGLDDAIMRKFGLGYAPERAGLLLQHLSERGFDPGKLETAGLVASRSDRGRSTGDYYERFRGRVIFPVFNATGRIVGFGGRILPDSPSSDKRRGLGGGAALAKYINSPDTPVYHKSQILYGLFQAKDAIRRAGFAILVEGYADVLAVYQAGVENVVAASGTSLTVEQLQLLRRYTTAIVLLFDADTAGKNATMRGIELAIEAGFDVSTVVLPAGEDPDSFIRQKGVEAFTAALEHRQSFIEAKAQFFEEQGAFRDPGRMAQAVRSIVETIAKVPDEIKRAFFIQKLGERFHLSEQLLSTELAKLLATSRDSEDRRAAREVARMLPDEPAEEQDDPSSFILQPSSLPVSRSEGALLEAMLADPTAVATLIEGADFRLDLIRHPIARELIGYLIQRVEEGDPPQLAQLLNEFRDKPEFESLLTTYGMAQAAFSANWDERPDESGIVAQARQAIAAIEREEIDKRHSEMPGVVRDDPFSDEHLREVLSLMERPEMQSRHVQKIGGEEA